MNKLTQFLGKRGMPLTIRQFSQAGTRFTDANVRRGSTLSSNTLPAFVPLPAEYAAASIWGVAFAHYLLDARISTMASPPPFGSA